MSYRCVAVSLFHSDFFLSFSLHHRFLTVQAHQVFAPWVQNTVRLYPNETAIEIEYTVGPIPFEDGLGKEIVSIWSTGVCLCCLTCVHRRHAVGRGVVHGLERARHAEARVQLPPHVEAQRHRPVSPCNIVFITLQYRVYYFHNNLSLTHHGADGRVSGNYYPVDSSIFIQDGSSRTLTVVTDRSQGGASLNTGEIELMVPVSSLLTQGAPSSVARRPSWRG